MHCLLGARVRNLGTAAGAGAALVVRTACGTRLSTAECSTIAPGCFVLGLQPLETPLTSCCRASERCGPHGAPALPDRDHSP